MATIIIVVSPGSELRTELWLFRACIFALVAAGMTGMAGVGTSTRGTTTGVTGYYSMNASWRIVLSI